MPFDVVAESIAVKGRADPVALEVRRTRNGPVIPVEGVGDSLLVSARWTALGPVGSVAGVLGLNRAVADDLWRRQQEFATRSALGSPACTRGARASRFAFPFIVYSRWPCWTRSTAW
mgnify:CR=1 FL=1